jgi:hypothetical protein
MSRYRTGRKVGNTLYDHDQFIGSCVTGYDARTLTALANDADRYRAALEQIAATPLGSMTAEHFLAVRAAAHRAQNPEAEEATP